MALKPCPFCGGNAELSTQLLGTEANGSINSVYMKIECSVCGASSRGKVVNMPKKEIFGQDTQEGIMDAWFTWLDTCEQESALVKRWNRRAETC